MVYIILSIVSCSLQFILFKYIARFKIQILPVIICGYFVSSVIGIVTIYDTLEFPAMIDAGWFIPAILLGIFLIGLFLTIAYSTQKAGVAITTVATKMSVIVPMLFSILYCNEAVGFLKISGMVLALVAVTLAVLPKDKTGIEKKYAWLPVILFFISGIFDSLIKFTQEAYISGNALNSFGAVLFIVSFITGLVAGFVQRNTFQNFFNYKTLASGLILGFCNYGALYFFINALNFSGLKSSSVFGITNIGIVSFSVVAAILLFKEKLSVINIAGIVLSVGAIIILMYS